MDEDVSTATLGADLYDPIAGTWSSAGTCAYARLYHSTALLLPNGTVVSAGSNPVRGTYEFARHRFDRYVHTSSRYFSQIGPELSAPLETGACFSPKFLTAPWTCASASIRKFPFETMHSPSCNPSMI
jgi:hypothetical protein